MSASQPVPARRSMLDDDGDNDGDMVRRTLNLYEDSETELKPESLSPHPQSSHLKKLAAKPQGYKRDPFVAPKYQKGDRAEANARISASLEQVDP